ncbi:MULTISPECIES: hypothetical protein [Bacteria]|uniref:hypothetical protein n=1 Tax=Bacteria TaxID=2 RepID=UPI003C7D3040
MSQTSLTVRRVRDLTVVDAAEGPTWVIACDSVGSIGPKSADAYAADARTVAHFAARVPLVEAMAAGATPEIIVDTLSVELDPTGAEMIAELLALAASLGLGPERVTGSTEDNVPSAATGIGVTVLATAGALRAGTASSGERVLLLGQPTSAPEDRIEIGDPRMVSLPTLAAVLALDGVSDALPVGSKGVGYEADVLARTNGLEWRPAEGHGVDLRRSGGPASCVLVSVRQDAMPSVLAAIPADLPRADLGVLS